MADSGADAAAVFGAIPYSYRVLAERRSAGILCACRNPLFGLSFC